MEIIIFALVGMMWLPVASPIQGSRDNNNVIKVDKIRGHQQTTELEYPMLKNQHPTQEVHYATAKTSDMEIMEAIYSRVKTNPRLYKVLTSKNISCAFVYLRTEGLNSNNMTGKHEKQMMLPDEHIQDVRIQVVNEFLADDTAEVGEEGIGSLRNQSKSNNYDYKGAMYFAVAVITIYGLSIALLIASSVRRRDEDYELKGFIRSFAKLRVDRVLRPRDKFKVGKALLESGALLRLTAQGHILAGASSSPSKMSSAAMTSSSVGNSSCVASDINSGQESSECSVDSGREEVVTMGDNGEYSECYKDIEEEDEDEEEEEDDVFETLSNGKETCLSKEERNVSPLGSLVSPGPRPVKIYQGKDRGKIDVRSMDVALDIPEYSAI